MLLNLRNLETTENRIENRRDYVRSIADRRVCEPLAVHNVAGFVVKLYTCDELRQFDCGTHDAMIGDSPQVNNKVYRQGYLSGLLHVSNVRLSLRWHTS